MRRARLNHGKWLVLAAGLIVSCSINPQPEPPGASAGPPSGAGGARNDGAGGVGYSIGTGGGEIASNTSATPGGGMMNAAGGASSHVGTSLDSDAGDSGVGDIDAGVETAPGEPAGW